MLRVDRVNGASGPLVVATHPPWSADVAIFDTASTIGATRDSAAPVVSQPSAQGYPQVIHTTFHSP